MSKGRSGLLAVALAACGVPDTSREDTARVLADSGHAQAAEENYTCGLTAERGMGEEPPTDPFVLPGPKPSFRQTDALPPPEGTSVPFSPVPCFNNMDMPGPSAFVIRDSATWERLWSRHFDYRGDYAPHGAPPAPHIDFARDMVIVVSTPDIAGCGEWLDHVERIEQGSDTLRVVVRGSPRESLGSCMGIYDAWQVVRTPRSDLPVLFTGPYAQEMEEEAEAEEWFTYQR